ncbi:MAG: serine hydrolase domain-containing protein [Myxococcota bacterium]
MTTRWATTALTIALANGACTQPGDGGTPEATGQTTDESGASSSGAPSAGVPSSGPDSGSGTTGGTAEEDAGSGSPETTSSGTLAELIDPLANRYVDATGADPTKAVGMVVVAIAGDDSDVLAYGAKEIGGDPPDPNTHFSIASVSKVLPGLAVAQQITAGQLTLDTDANELLGPDLRLPSRSGQSITIEHLLTHYAGLPGLPVHRLDRDADGVPDNADTDPTNDIPECCPVAGYTREDFAVELALYETEALTLESVPGTQYTYSNHGNGTLNLVVADGFGYDSGESALRDLVFDPLGMHDSATHVEPFVSEALANHATGYNDPGSGTLMPLPFLDVGVFAGDVISTGADMLRLLEAYVHPAASPWPDAVLLALEPLRPTGPGRQIAFAVDIRDEDEARTYGKGGDYRGYKAFLYFSHDPATGVVVMMNNGSAGVDARLPALEIHSALVAATR